LPVAPLPSPRLGQSPRPARLGACAAQGPFTPVPGQRRGALELGAGFRDAAEPGKQVTADAGQPVVLEGAAPASASWNAAMRGQSVAAALAARGWQAAIEACGGLQSTRLRR